LLQCATSPISAIRRSAGGFDQALDAGRGFSYTRLSQVRVRFDSLLTQGGIFPGRAPAPAIALC
jgi:hypothetical protein